MKTNTMIAAAAAAAAAWWLWKKEKEDTPADQVGTPEEPAPGTSYFDYDSFLMDLGY